MPLLELMASPLAWSLGLLGRLVELVDVLEGERVWIERWGCGWRRGVLVPLILFGAVVEAVEEIVKGGSWGDVICACCCCWDWGFEERAGEVELVS